MLNIGFLVENPEKCDALLAELSDTARKHNSYEYGLPLYDDSVRAEMREVIYRWANNLSKPTP